MRMLHHGKASLRAEEMECVYLDEGQPARLPVLAQQQFRLQHLAAGVVEELLERIGRGHPRHVLHHLWHTRLEIPQKLRITEIIRRD